MRFNARASAAVAFCLFFANVLANAQASSNTSSDEYILGVGDVISVAINGDPELSRADLKINGSGQVYLPLLANGVKASGKTAAGLQAEISEAYKSGHFLKNPQAVVTVKEYHS